MLSQTRPDGARSCGCVLALLQSSSASFFSSFGRRMSQQFSSTSHRRNEKRPATIRGPPSMRNRTKERQQQYYSQWQGQHVSFGVAHFSSAYLFGEASHLLSSTVRTGKSAALISPCSLLSEPYAYHFIYLFNSTSLPEILEVIYSFGATKRGISYLAWCE